MCGIGLRLKGYYNTGSYVRAGKAEVALEKVLPGGPGSFVPNIFPTVDVSGQDLAHILPMFFQFPSLPLWTAEGCLNLMRDFKSRPGLWALPGA